MNPVETLKAVLCGQDGKCCIAGSEADRKVVDEALAALDTAQPVQANEWKAAVIDALVAAHILTPENAIYPRKAVQDVIDWNCQVALDPRVSSKAQALVDSGKSVQVNAMLVEALEQAQPERAPLTVDVFYLEGHDPFICAVYGKISLGALSEIESDIQGNPDFQKGDGVYSYSVTRFEGQYGFEGRCELAPGWELVEYEFTPIDAAIKQGGQQ